MRLEFIRGMKAANEGHYLARLLGLARIFRPDLAPVLKATLELQLETQKRDWTDSLTLSVSRSILYAIRELDPTEKELRAVVWGLDFEVLEEENLLHLRREK